jgi:enoyl-CoA hydratase/carnithine racemase
MPEQIDFTSADAVAQIAINRPEKKNALTAAMYGQLVIAFKRADVDPAVRVIVVHGTDGCFTAGNDLKDFMSAPPSDDASLTVQFLKTIHAVRKPIVAGVAGSAVGIGTTMLLHCDLVYADPSTRFQLPFVNLGLCPEAASSLLLPRIVGHQRACELLLFGDPFSAATALDFGLINAVTPDGEAVSTALEKAKALAARPSASVILTKMLMKKAYAPLMNEHIDAELKHFGERLKSPEAAEAFQAFFERRKPDFSKFA